MSTVYLASTRNYFEECGFWGRVKLAWAYLWDAKFRKIRTTEITFTSEELSSHHASLAAQRNAIVGLQDQVKELEDEAKWDRLDLHMAKKDALIGGTLSRIVFGMGDSTPIPLGHLPYLPGGKSSTQGSQVSEYKSSKDVPYPLHPVEEMTDPAFQEDPP